MQNDIQKKKVEKVSSGLWVIQGNDIGEDDEFDLLKEDLQYIEETINEYKGDESAKRVWFIKLDGDNKFIEKIKQRLKNISKDSYE